MSSIKGKSARTQATPKTTRQPVEGLSFFYEVKGPKGGYTGGYYLNFPDEEYLYGCVTGYRAANELLTRIEAREIAPWIIHEIYKLSFEGEPNSGFGPSNRGARRALQDVLAKSMVFMAQSSQYSKWLDGKIAECLEGARKDAEREQQRIQRSIEARRAKRAAKAEGGAQ